MRAVGQAGLQRVLFYDYINVAPYVVLQLRQIHTLSIVYFQSVLVV